LRNHWSSDRGSEGLRNNSWSLWDDGGSKGLRNHHWLGRKERSWDSNRLGGNSEDWSLWDSVQSLDGLSISSLPLSCSQSCCSFSLDLFVSGEMLGAGSSDLRSLNNSNRGYEGSGDRNLRGDWETKWSSSRGDRNVGGGNSESVDIISSVMDSLDNVVGINILVASSGDSEGVLGFSSGRVDVLVAEAELTQLVLGMELA